MASDFYQTIGSNINGGSDVQFNSKGDILTVNGVEKTRQRIMRRLLTNPGDYFWHPNYGAGLPQEIGKLLSDKEFDEIKTRVVSQILLEASVARIPLPQVELRQRSMYVLIVTIAYTDAQTNTSQVLSFNVTK